MAAQIDRSQTIRFYFGNAEKDLAHLLPRQEDQVATPSHAAQEIIALLERTESSLTQLIESRRMLSFLISDLKRMIA